MEKTIHQAPFARPLRRIKAFIADIIVLFVPAVLINNYLVQANLGKTALVLYAGIFSILCFAYFVYFTYKKDGATPGKKFMKIQVVSVAGKLTLSQIVLRYAVLFLVFWAIPFLLVSVGAKNISDPLSVIFIIFAAVMLFLDKKRQVFHDKAAKTLVVEKK